MCLPYNSALIRFSISAFFKTFMKQNPVSRIGLFVGFLDAKKLLIQLISILRKHLIFTLEIKVKIHKLVRFIVWFTVGKSKQTMSEYPTTKFYVSNVTK